MYLRPHAVRRLGAAVKVGRDALPDVVLEVDLTTDVRRGKLAMYESWGVPDVWVEVPEVPDPGQPPFPPAGIDDPPALTGRLRPGGGQSGVHRLVGGGDPPCAGRGRALRRNRRRSSSGWPRHGGTGGRGRRAGRRSLPVRRPRRQPPRDSRRGRAGDPRRAEGAPVTGVHRPPGDVRRPAGLRPRARRPGLPRRGRLPAAPRRGPPLSTRRPGCPIKVKRAPRANAATDSTSRDPRRNRKHRR